MDECHFLEDRTRGMPLQTLLLKLKEEQDPQFCLLTATFAKSVAEWWSAQMGCELIAPPLIRRYRYQAVLLKLGISDPVNFTQLEQRKIEKVCEVLQTYLKNYDGKNLPRIFIFCAARWLARATAQAIL